MESVEEAKTLLKNEISEQNLIKHCLAVAAIMKAIAKKLGENENLWEITGLLHDFDYEETKDNHKQHGLIASEKLKQKLPPESLHAIEAHNFENTSVLPESKIDYALIAADAISGLVIATALVRPSKKLEDVKPKSIKKKFKQKEFAKNCSRKKILYCEKLGIELSEFIEISLISLKRISKNLGL